MSKRGQITVFIIIGLIIVLAIAILYFLGSQEASSRMSTTLDVKSINQEKQLIQSCVDKETKEALVLVGNAGSLNSKEYVETSEGNIALFSKSEELPSVKDMLAQVSDESNILISSCLVNVHSDSPELPLSDYVLNSGEEGIGTFSVAATPLERTISFTVDSTLRFKTYDSEFAAGRFSSSSDVDLEKIHEIAEAILNQLEADNGLLDSELFLDLEQQGVDIEIYLTEDSAIIRLIDLSHSLAGIPYTYQFAVHLADYPAVGE